MVSIFQFRTKNLYYIHSSENNIVIFTQVFFFVPSLTTFAVEVSKPMLSLYVKSRPLVMVLISPGTTLGSSKNKMKNFF